MARYKTVLDIVSRAAMEVGIAQQPVSSVTSTQDQDIAQMRELLHTVADDILLEEPYVSSLGDGNWLFDINGQPKDNITDNLDRVAFDGRLAVNGVKWRFLAAKGLEFAEQQRDFTTRLAKLAGFQNGRVLDLDLEWGVVQ